MICRKRKLIFIHIPKAGGTSVEDYFWPKPRSESDLWAGYVQPGVNKHQTGGLQHLTAQLVRKEVGRWTFRRCYRFAIVRDPVDRMISQFNYLNRRPDLLELLGLGQDRDFQRYLDATRQVQHVQWMPQRDFLVDDRGALLVNMIRLEAINQDIQQVAAALRIEPITLPHSNKSIEGVVPDDWTTIRRSELSKGELQTICNLYQQDFDLLGYPMP
ncbi:sulfotransferase family 2 domain-containing protein [uncultured Aliiroseovarius sp.]|uniref:sulfotransferase family 2 domain-containing protein n=1 Tax=uncultured Aliiroseovarius sp. TaxID=1658783 RepID=UPI002608EF34|nr:sulfotransferase family 2 domain-containing protein [uncultured Aliiroseovarius sp.]